MGIDNDARLVVGWLLPWHDLKQWLLAKGEHGCSKDEGDCCAHCECWDVELPAGWRLDSASPHFDCPCEEHQHYLSLAKIRAQKTTTLHDVQAALGRPETTQAAELARAMGARRASAKTAAFWALPHIW